MPDKEKLPEEPNDLTPYKFSDEVTKGKIRRHIKDINDVITEKDIKDAKVPGTEKPASGKPGKKGKKSKKNIVDDLPGNPASPWDILND